MVNIHVLRIHCPNCHRRPECSSKSILLSNSFESSKQRYRQYNNNIMLRLCQRFGSRQSIYLRPSQMEYNSPILSAGLSCLQNTITQSKHRPLNQIYSRNFIKTVFGQPNDPATINIYNGTFAIRLEFLKLFAMVTTFVGVGNYKEIYGAISELGGLVTTVALCSLSTIAIGSIPAAIHLFSKKYVVEMRHNPQTDEYSVALISLWMSKKWVS